MHVDGINTTHGWNEHVNFSLTCIMVSVLFKLLSEDLATWHDLEQDFSTGYITQTSV